MAQVQPQTILPAHSAVLPEFKTDAGKLHDIKYNTALEAERSRDLYLQGAMAVGQIARLLEELCADDDDDDEEKFDDFPTAPVEDVWDPQFISYEKRCSIEAWAHAVALGDALEDDVMPQSDAESIAHEDAEHTYLRGAFVVGDIAEILEDLLNCISDEEQPAQIHQPVTEKIPTAQLPESMSEDHLDFDLALRIENLSARLDRLEVDIDEFSKDRCDALSRLETELAAEDDGNDDDHEHIDNRLEFALHALGFRLPSSHKEDRSSLPITRISTTTDTTTTSGFSLATPPESEIQPPELELVKDCFWSLA